MISRLNPRLRIRALLRGILCRERCPHGAGVRCSDRVLTVEGLVGGGDTAATT